MMDIKKNKEELERHEALIVNSLSGRLNEAEQIELSKWRAASPDNEAYYSDMKKTWEYSGLLNEMRSYDTVRALVSFQEKAGIKTSITNRAFVIFQRVAAILLLPLLVTFYVFYNVSDQTKRSNEQIWQTVQCPAGTRSSMKLADGTKVWLNAGTKMEMPLTFSTQKREVKVIGEAFFEVASDSTWPFYVNMGALNVKVTGTSFDVKNYLDEDHLEVNLQEGEVQVYSFDSNHQEQLLSVLQPNESIHYYPTTSKWLKTKYANAPFAQWKEGRLQFMDEDIQSFVKKMERWYNVEISMAAGVKWDDFLITATFTDEPITEVLEMVKYLNGVNYTIDKIKGKKKQIKLYKK
jgi:ferric-dicitrate binding protein FerR (iron transport regulator)